MNKTATFIVVVTVGALAIGGCNKSPAAVSPKALETDPVALQAAMKACETTAQAGTQSGSDCQHVGYTAYQLRSQYAAGLAAEYKAASGVRDYYEKSSKLPVSNDQVGLPAATTVPNGIEFVRSVAVGPTPGAITVTWSHTAAGMLADKTLVLAPMESKRAPYLCWKIDPSSTVPDVIRQMRGPTIVMGCAY